MEGQSTLLALCVYFLLVSEPSGIRARETEGSQRKGGGFLLTWSFRDFSVLITDARDAEYSEAWCSGRRAFVVIGGSRWSTT